MGWCKDFCYLIDLESGPIYKWQRNTKPIWLIWLLGLASHETEMSSHFWWAFQQRRPFKKKWRETREVALRMCWAFPRQWEIRIGKYKRIMWIYKKAGTEEAAWHHKGGPILYSHCKSRGRRGLVVKNIGVGDPVGCGKLVEEALVRISNSRKYLKGKKMSSPFA